MRDDEMNCKFCFSENVVEVIDLGELPIAHRYIINQNDDEERFPLNISYCKNCGLIYIKNPINPEILYRDYNHCFSSWKDQPHIGEEIETIIKNSKKDSVIEIACNDGIFLEELRKAGFNKVVGVEPNKVSGKMSEKKGFKIYNEMLTQELARSIVKEQGKFEVLAARQVLEHIIDIEDFIKCIDILLKEDGLLFIDVPDVKDSFLNMGDLSFVWEEHPNYFTELTLKNILKKYHYVPFLIKNYGFSSNTLAILSRKTRLELIQDPISEEFEKLVLNYKNKVKEYGNYLKKTLQDFRDNNYKIVLYGVGCRASMLLNGLGLKNYIDFAVDDQKERQGIFMAGSKLKINNPEYVYNLDSSIVCLLAVNQENENKVKSRFLENIKSRNTSADVKFASIFSPADINEELRKLNESNVVSVTA